MGAGGAGGGWSTSFGAGVPEVLLLLVLGVGSLVCVVWWVESGLVESRVGYVCMHVYRSSPPSAPSTHLPTYTHPHNIINQQRT